MSFPESVERFREFIRIPTVSGEGMHGSYAQAAEWLVKRCEVIPGVRVSVISPVENKPIVIATLEGRDPTLPSIVLNSHYDVVPVMREHWSVDPFAAEVKDGYGDGPQVSAELRDAGPCVFGRGTQDMKCVCVQYLEALENLVEKSTSETGGGGGEGGGGGGVGGWKEATPFLRSIHLTFVPDEEIGGADGMGKLLETKEFQSLMPIALALDEGLANPRSAFTVFYGERTPWWLLVRAEGPTGHGSRFIQNTAVEKLMGVVQKALAFRKGQEEALGWGTPSNHEGCKHATARKLGDVTTLNVTMLKTGVSCDGGKTYALNVIPTEAEAGFDVRISPSLATAEFKKTLDEWCQDEGLSWSFAPWFNPLHDHLLTDIDRASNPFWGIFEDALSSLAPVAPPSSSSSSSSTTTAKTTTAAAATTAKAAATTMSVEREIFPAATDSRFLRKLGIQAVGFSPMASTPTLLHEHDEALSVATFLAGISAYETIISSLANAPADTEAKATPRCHPCAPAAAAAAAADFESATGKGEGQQQQSPSKRAKA